MSRTTLRLSAADSLLIKRKFRCPDPESLPGIEILAKKGDFNGELEFTYNLTPKRGESRPKVYCTNCGRPTHWVGFVFKNDNGSRFLIGKDCGKTHYGQTFQESQHHFDQQVIRKIQIQRMGFIGGNIIDLLNYIYYIKRSKVCIIIDKAKRTLFQNMRSLYLAISNCGGALTLTREVSIDLRIEQTKRFIVDHFWDVKGMRFITYPDNLESRLDSSQIALQQLKQRIDIDQSDKWRSKDFKSVNKQLKDLSDLINEIFLVQKNYTDFLSPENLQQIVAWANKTDSLSGRYQTQANNIYCSEPFSNEAVTLFEPFEKISESFLLDQLLQKLNTINIDS